MGGPGLGFSPANRDFFDLETINLIQYEQRGCGRSLTLKWPSSTSKKLAYELMYFENSVSIKSRNFEADDAMLTQSDYLQEAKILVHYSVHDFFFKDEYIMNNLSSIEGIPSYIVQGRYDVITTPDIAYHLHEKLENSQLFIVESGHSQGEEEIKRRLTSILKTLTISN